MPSMDGSLTAGPKGAVIVRIEKIRNSFQGPFTSMSQLPTANVFPPSVPQDVRDLTFPFNKVDTLSWGQSGRQCLLLLRYA